MSELMRIANAGGNITIRELLYARGIGNHLIAELYYGAPECTKPWCPCHES